MSIFMDDVDVLHEEYKKSGAIIRMVPTDMPWGVREMNVEDPDGDRFRMGSDSKGQVDQEGLQRFANLEESPGYLRQGRSQT